MYFIENVGNAKVYDSFNFFGMKCRFQWKQKNTNTNDKIYKTLLGMEVRLNQLFSKTCKIVR